MTRKLLITLALTLVTASAALAAPARLTVLSGASFAVRGTSFQAGEHILVIAIVNGERGSKRLAAGTGGGFVARFPTLHIGSCGAYTVRATGDRGSRSILRVMPECPQPLTQ